MIHDQPCSFIGVKSSHLSLQKSQVAMIFRGDFFTWPPTNNSVFPKTVIMFIFIFRCSFYGFPEYQRGWCIRSTLATKLLHIVLLHEDNTQQDLKNSSPRYTYDKNLHQLSAMLVHYFWKYAHFSEHHFPFSWSDFVACSRNLWTTKINCFVIIIIVPIIGFMVLKRLAWTQCFNAKIGFEIYSPSP